MKSRISRILTFYVLACLVQAAEKPEPSGWFAGDAHVHLDCGVAAGVTVTPEDILAAMKTNDLALVSLMADMGNGEVRDAARDLPKISRKDLALSTPQRIVHWDAEWHFDPHGVTFDEKAIGGHLILLGLQRGARVFSEYTYPVIERARKQNAIVGYAHMQYLKNDIPQELDCCAPLEYPVETALGTIDFLMEDVNGGETAIQGYYRLLNCGFRPGLAAATDFPCNFNKPIGTQLTYVRTADGKLSYRGWIEGLAKGRTVVSRNAHREFLDLKVNGTNAPGDEVRLSGKGSVKAEVRWSAATPLSGRIELVRNGKVVASRDASAAPGAPAVLSAAINFDDSGWIAARRMAANGHQVHTGAIYVTLNSAPVRASPADAEFFVRFIDNLLRQTSPGGAWSSFFAHDRDAAQARYRRARATYESIAAEARARNH
ncbi:MAG: Developmentally Regulated Interacting Protein [Bryobacterales bacterium]|nr:Developmentally Regulated Interacting Protein [Bryobacterales bacterium]